MKSISAIVFFISLCLSASAFADHRCQSSSTITPKKKETAILNLSGCSSKPIGEYASTDLNLNTSGLALSGWGIKASMVLKFSKYIGVGAEYNYQTNAVATKVLDKEFMVANPGITHTTKATNWNIKGFYGGLYLTLPFKTVSGLSLFGGAYVGLPRYVTPSITTTRIEMSTGAKATITQSSANKSAPGYFGSVGLIYKFNDFFGLNVCANYFSGKAEFEDVYISSSNNTFSYLRFSQKFESLNVHAGVCFIFNNK